MTHLPNSALDNTASKPPMNALMGSIFIPNIILFSQVGVITKFLNSMIFKYFEFIEYFDDVK